jgi:methionyl-tRNA formyltransferase
MMKRLEFLTQDDPLYILPLFAEFFRAYSGEFEIAQVSCCRTMGSRPRSKLLKELLLLYGTVGFSRLAARVAAGKLLSVVPAGRGADRYWSMRQLCRAYGVPFRPIGSPNDTAYIEGLRGRGPDLMVSVACPYILKAPVLESVPMGCINIHHAPLPYYRGMMPTFWQLYHGESRVGVTIHYVNEKIDEGEVLFQESLPVESGESLDHVIRRSKEHGAHCLARVIRELPRPHRTVQEVRPSAGSYFTFPTPQQIREFHRKGLRAI